MEICWHLSYVFSDSAGASKLGFLLNMDVGRANISFGVLCYILATVLKGGVVDADETPEEAARRELEEEFQAPRVLDRAPTAL